MNSHEVGVADGKTKTLAAAAVAVVVTGIGVAETTGAIIPMLPVITAVAAIATIITAGVNSIKDINHPFLPVYYFH